MKALVLESYNNLVYKDMPMPEIAADEVLVRVRACGICGSDVHGLDGSTGRRIPPLIMGHEASGVIEKTGSAVKDYSTGNRVTFDSTLYCGSCHFCRKGQINLCDNRRVLGVACDEYSRHGAFAEYVAVPERILYRLPDKVSFEAAAMVEPVSVAFHALSLAQVSLNESAVVFGAGIIGLFVIQLLRANGCGNILAVDTDSSRLALARELGATDILNPADDKVDSATSQLTGGRRFDMAFEAVGVQATLSSAVDTVRKGGRIVLIGNVSPKLNLHLQKTVSRQITLLGSCASNGEYPACLDMIARGAVNVERLTSATAPLAEGAAWFKRLYNREQGLMKVLLQP